MDTETSNAIITKLDKLEAQMKGIEDLYHQRINSIHNILNDQKTVNTKFLDVLELEPRIKKLEGYIAEQIQQSRSVIESFQEVLSNLTPKPDVKVFDLDAVMDGIDKYNAEKEEEQSSD